MNEHAAMMKIFFFVSRIWSLEERRARGGISREGDWIVWVRCKVRAWVDGYVCMYGGRAESTLPRGADCEIEGREVGGFCGGKQLRFVSFAGYLLVNVRCTELL